MDRDIVNIFGTRRKFCTAGFLGCCSLLASRFSLGADGDETDSRREISRNILTDAEWRDVETAIDKGLKFLHSQQRADGSFQTVDVNDPGISSLCLMAFLSRGHLPDQGPYAETLKRAVRFIINCQQSDGLISLQRHPNYSVYNHAISALVLSELYGISPQENDLKLKAAIEAALKFTSHRYPQPKRMAHDEGSWRYLDIERRNDGDLSITSWSVMFLRSAKNAGFEIDVKMVDEALAYMKQLYVPGKAFRYAFYSEAPTVEFHRAMAGAAILSLALAGEHHSTMAKGTAEFLLKQPFVHYDRPPDQKEFTCYAAFYCSQGMFQMGGEYWNQFYPQLVQALLKSQRDNGSWTPAQSRESPFGAAYTTALSVLALTPPYQMLPIFQR